MDALDLFAGTGWAVAGQKYDITDLGVDNWQPVVDTRAANGFQTVYRDVWEGLKDPSIVPSHELLIASPPCQTFSMTGGGAGRRALTRILAAIRAGEYADLTRLAPGSIDPDERTALALTPLAYAYKFRPRLIAWEEVPPVIPLWEACAEELEHLGYSTAAGVVNTEQYGDPQTRRRAVLLARNDRIPAKLPRPTHSKFYPRQPETLDRGVAPWRTISDALGWYDPEVRWQNTKQTRQARRRMDQPACTVTGGHTSAERGFIWPDGTFRRATPQEAALLMSYPADFRWEGPMTKQFQQIGNAVPIRTAEAILGALVEP